MGSFDTVRPALLADTVCISVPSIFQPSNRRLSPSYLSERPWIAAASTMLS
jgi:hypothetical protein